MRIGLVALPLAVWISGCGTRALEAPARQVRAPINAEDTVSIIGIELRRQLVGFIFISRNGSHYNLSADQCDQSSHCRDLVQRLGVAGKTDLIEFVPPTSAQSDSQDQCSPPESLQNHGQTALQAFPRHPLRSGWRESASSLPSRDLTEPAAF